MHACLHVATSLLFACSTIGAQAPDAKTLDAWWLGAFDKDQQTAKHNQARLLEHAEAAADRGIVLLRSDDEPSGQGLAFQIAALRTPGFRALLRECVRTDSPARAIALEGALWYQSRYMEDAPDYQAERQALREALVACLNASDDELLHQLSFGVSGVDDVLRAMFEDELAAPAPIGPRAALFLDESPRSHPPLRALLAAFDDPLASVRAMAIAAVSKRDDPEAKAAVAEAIRQASGENRRAAILSLIVANSGPWGEEVVTMAAKQVGAPLPGPLARDWFEDLGLRSHLVNAAKMRIKLRRADAEECAPILIAALSLPQSDADWIRYHVDQMRAEAIGPLLELQGELSELALEQLAKLAEREPIALPLQAIVFRAQLEFAPPRRAERVEWAARYRRAVETASTPLPGRQLSHQAAEAIAATYDVLGRLGDYGSRDWLRQRMLGDGEARAAAAGALLRLTDEESAARQVVRDYLATKPGRWPHYEVLASALDDRGAAAVWSVPALLERLPDRATKQSRSIVASIGSIAEVATAEDRETIREQILQLLRATPRHPHAAELAKVIARADPAAALALRADQGFGQSLYLAAFDVAPELFVPLLDGTDRGYATHAAGMLKSYGRPEAKTLHAFQDLLQREELRDPNLVLATLAKIGASADMLPHIERWLPRSRQAMQAMVSAGQAAVPRIIAVGLAHLDHVSARALHRLGASGAPLIPALLELQTERQRYLVTQTLPYFGTAGIDALRNLQPDETEFCRTLASALRGTFVTEEAQIAIAEELLLHPDVDSIGETDLSRYGQSPRLAARLLLLQGSRDPNGKAATEALLEALASPEAKLRAFAVRQLANNPDRGRIARYVHWLREDPEPDVQRALRAFDAARNK